MSTFDQVKEIVANQLSIPAEKITAETTFEQVEADSLDVVEVIMSIESTFNIDLPDGDVEQFKNVGDLSNYVDKLLA
ncbi:MAG: acyl carrier protein [Clostridiales bacterium]|uniref:Acyl carrier protein n=1 Tax=Peptococcus niger TaxID=2741 RepID=A0A1G6RRH8_PEPNI|nr:acyl carrier protein [Peptococcus niger]MBS5594403.1 acyl carrier protein [Clostridiales bacterium]MBS5916562.1 acyl carrier protein [Clostridiales bacterium]MDU1028513.1 acyl carrier protein [Clostridiales bacterium]MDU5952274.1 acyl carrier protein [Clostridiales bacterium]SDD07148.1 acyl carrier protein [Peptococcus niger]